jgi:hypothetical protein
VIVLYRRLCYWLCTSATLWRKHDTPVAPVTSGSRTSRQWCVLLVTLSIGSLVGQWYLRPDDGRPVELGLMLPEQAFAQAVATSTMLTAPEADATIPVPHAGPVTSAAPSSDSWARPVAVPAALITESADTTTSQACLSAPRQSAASDVSPAAPTTPRRRAAISSGAQRRQTTPVRQPRRTMTRLAPPRGLGVVAVASRSALLRLPQGLLVTVQAGTSLQGWTVQRFVPSGVIVVHHDQRTVLPLTRETSRVR